VSKRGDYDKWALKSLGISGERSLHRGEVVGSIPTAPTKKNLQLLSLDQRPLPFPPALNHEQNMFAPAKLGENRGSLFETCSRQCADKTHKENQGNLAGSQTLVIRFEGVGAGRKYRVHSDIKALFTPFDSKGLFALVRTAVGRRSPAELPLLPRDLATNATPQASGVALPRSECPPRSHPLTRKPPGPLPSDQEAKDSKYAKTRYGFGRLPARPSKSKDVSGQHIGTLGAPDISVSCCGRVRPEQR